MIAADTSTWIAFLKGQTGNDVDMLSEALELRQIVVPPAVLTELLSDSNLPASVARSLSELPLLEPQPEYWERCGRLRARVLARKRKARLGDALIAQSCIDARTPLITRDDDFRAFADAAGLKLLFTESC